MYNHKRHLQICLDVLEAISSIGYDNRNCIYLFSILNEKSKIHSYMMQKNFIVSLDKESEAHMLLIAWLPRDQNATTPSKRFIAKLF